LIYTWYECDTIERCQSSTAKLKGDYIALEIPLLEMVEFRHPGCFYLIALFDLPLGCVHHVHKVLR
jgi:hypothetical protein